MSLAPMLDRRTEMARLLTALDRARAGAPQLLIMYGKRRVGKTFLALHVLARLQDEEAGVYLAATGQSSQEEYRRLVDAAADAGIGLDADPLPGHWQTALDAIAVVSTTRLVVLVIDEFPFLMTSHPGFDGIVRSWWDLLTAHVEKRHLLVVLTGSAVTTMTRLVGGTGALFRRATTELRVDPFDELASHEALPIDPESLVQAYAVCGGYPLHLRGWDPGVGLRDNLTRLVGPGGLLLDAAAQMLRELASSPGSARVLEAVGRGSTRRNDIEGAAGQRIDSILPVLLDGDYLRRELPVGAPAKATPLYTVPDPYLRFWFSAIAADQQRMAGGQVERTLDRVWPRIQQHLGWVWEEIARRHAVRLADTQQLPPADMIGRWWTHKGQAAEIDVLGLRDGRVVFAGEAKWSRQPFTTRDLVHLRDTAALCAPLARDAVLAVWNRGGVAGELPGYDVRSLGVADALSTSS